MSIIEVKNLCKSFFVGNHEMKIVKNINFNVEKGNFISIMGPSGGGKSTLLYLLGGLDKPTSGSVHIQGKDLSRIREKDLSKMRRTDMGFVFQFYNLVPNLTVEDNIMLPIMMDGKRFSDCTKKLDELLEFIGMAEKKKLTPRELSGGQQQRVAIARSLIFEPDIIFLDEPIGNLDSKNGNDVMELFQKINKDFKKTIIQVTHSETSAAFGTHIYKLVDGEIIDIKEVKVH